MQTLRDWYRYLERQMQVSLSEEPGTPSGDAEAGADVPVPSLREPSGAPPTSSVDAPPPGLNGPDGEAASPGRDSARLAGGTASAQEARTARALSETARQRGGAAEPSVATRRRGGRRPMTETREEIIRRLLDPEVALHEAAAVLRLSKATVRRYCDQGKLLCRRTKGGQRRFRLSALLSFLDRQSAERAAG